MRIAVEGCAHGELEKIYETISRIEKQENYKIDLLICCGDFQASRNLEDLDSMAVPKKYQNICTFYKYYSGEKVAPMLTLFIGGNHEASNHLQELPYGGWVAPNIYYLGYAGVVNVNGVRIAGISGIYKGHDFFKGHFEFPPYSESTKKSVYHTRQLEVFRLKQLSGNIDVFLSHDWPRGIFNYGNVKQLIRFKPHFRDDIENNQLGSPASQELLNVLQPTYWFSAHMHCKFAALVPHEDSGKFTKFLALDKCLPKRRFLQVVELEDAEEPNDSEKLNFEYDLEWLSILFLTNHLLNAKNSIRYMPGPNGSDDERYNFTPTDDEKELVKNKFKNDLRIPENFSRNTEPYNPNGSTNQSNLSLSSSISVKINQQTVQFCDQLSIDDPLTISMTMSGHDLSQSSITTDGSDRYSTYLVNSSNDLFQSFNSSQDSISPLKRKSLNSSLPKPKYLKENDEEIDIDDDQEDDDDDEALTSNDNKSDHDDETGNLIGENLPNTDVNLTESVANTVEQVSECSPKPFVKQFKRRNQEIYSTQND